MTVGRNSLTWKGDKLYNGNRLIAWISKDHKYDCMWWIEGIADILYSEDYYNRTRAKYHAETLTLTYLNETDNEEKEA